MFSEQQCQEFNIKTTLQSTFCFFHFNQIHNVWSKLENSTISRRRQDFLQIESAWRGMLSCTFDISYLIINESWNSRTRLFIRKQQNNKKIKIKSKHNFLRAEEKAKHKIQEIKWLSHETNARPAQKTLIKEEKINGNTRTRIYWVLWLRLDQGKAKNALEIRKESVGDGFTHF